MRYIERDGVLELPEHLFEPVGSVIDLQLGNDSFDTWCPKTQGVVLGEDPRPVNLERGAHRKILYFVAIRDVYGVSIFEGVDINYPIAEKGFMIMHTMDSLKRYLRSYKAKGDNTRLIKGRLDLLQDVVDSLPLTIYKFGKSKTKNKLVINRKYRYENIEKVQRIRGRDVDTGRSSSERVLSL